MAAAGTEERSSLPDAVPTSAATSRNSTTNAGGFTNFGFLPIPKNLRYDPAHPAHFGLLLNVVFGISATFFVANLYYCQPLLIKMSQSFDASYDDVSRIPTLIQAGYATGLVLISPLGDLVPRRPLLLLVAFVSASLTIGLALSHSLAAFQALSFLIGASSVAPQILIPLAADLAPPARRATAISIVFSGLLLGVLLARIVAGLVAEWASWRVVYYIAVGAQYAVLASLWATTPDYPAKNGHLT
ncbi:MFS general substrate transporter, partial [Artomyces pyxidatus]